MLTNSVKHIIMDDQLSGKKCQYVMDNDFGGVMIWQLFQDAYQEELKLIKVVGEVIMQE